MALLSDMLWNLELEKNFEIILVYSFILQVGKLRPREVKIMGRKGQKLAWDPDLWISKSC